jgi:S-adenosyl-L-methionine hydrolase (adenosine-forming)
MNNYLIVLMTDFGINDHFVGIMKGVIFKINPNAKVFDLTHAIEPHNIKHAAFILEISEKYYPENTIFCTVVDPGVGSNREIIALKKDEKIFLAPNNGILSYIINNDDYEEYLFVNNFSHFIKSISNTFHGRDVFAPIAAHLSNGIPIEDFSEKCSFEDIVQIEKPLCYINEKNELVGEVIYVDHFGNLMTSIHRAVWENFNQKSKIFQILINDKKIEKLSKTYSDVGINEPLAYIGSSEYLEIAIRNGNAAKYFQAISGGLIKIV